MAGRVVIVGGSSGIGLATATLAAQAGHEVLIAGRSAERLRRAVKRVGHGAQARPLDVTDHAAVAGFFGDVAAIDHLVLTAAGARSGPFTAQSVATARAVFEVKFWGQYACARAASPKLRGSVTLFSGISARKPFVGLHALAAANGAVEALTRALALELAPVRVNAVAPGLVDTPAYAAMPEAERAAMFASIGERLPARRTGRPEDVAATVLHLIESPFITGSVVDVDGGYRLI